MLEVGHSPVEFVPGDAVGHSPTLEEAPITVPRGPSHMRFATQPFGHLVIHSDVKVGVHGSRHGDSGAGADGEKERVFRISQLFAGDLFQFRNLLPDQFLDFGRQFRVLQNRPAMPEKFGGQDKAGRYGEIIGIELFQKIGLGTEEDLVVHLRCAPVNGTDDQIRVETHNVVQYLGRQTSHHGPQGIEHVGDEVIQRLHEKGGRKHLPVKLFRYPVNLLLILRTGYALTAGLMEGHDFQRSVKITEKILVDDLADVLGHELEKVDELIQGKACGREAVLEHLQVRVEALIGDAVKHHSVAEQLDDAGDPAE